MKYKPLPTQERLKELFEYDEEQGVLVWKVGRGRAQAGSVAGFTKRNSRVSIRVDRGDYEAHRLIWMLHYGEDPGDTMIDHKDENPSNNHIENLRLATHGQNVVNSSKIKGYYLNKVLGKFVAQITINSKQTYLGLFRTEAEARDAYVEKAREVYGEFCPV